MGLRRGRVNPLRPLFFNALQGRGFGPLFAVVVRMILLIWSSEKAADCAKAIEDTFQQCVQVAATLHEGCERLRLEEYTAVVVDQGVTEVDPAQADYLFHHLGTAVPVFVNFSISGVERILRELRAAFNRHGRETLAARHTVRLALCNELKDDVTALLLSCGMALDDPALSAAGVARMKKVEEAAVQIKIKLVLSEAEESLAAAGE
jgi:hypothetical protein